jgi:hypothetical protein
MIKQQERGAEWNHRRPCTSRVATKYAESKNETAAVRVGAAARALQRARPDDGQAEEAKHRESRSQKSECSSERPREQRRGYAYSLVLLVTTYR